MEARVIRVLLVMAMLFGSMMSPTIAHASGQEMVHLFEGAHGVMYFDLEAMDAAHDGGNSSPDASENLLPHHHCASSFALVAPYALLNVTLDRLEMFLPHMAVALGSWTTAPPTQPPSS